MRMISDGVLEEAPIRKYEVKLVSKDNHVFSFSTICENEHIAAKKAFKRLEEVGYSHYSYTLQRVTNG